MGFDSPETGSSDWFDSNVCITSFFAISMVKLVCLNR